MSNIAVPASRNAQNEREIAVVMDSANTLDRYLSYQGIYPCPVCRVGQIQALSLMDAMACECCHNIFTADLERQVLKLPSRQPPLTWYWGGRNWRGGHVEGIEWGWTNWLFAAAFVILPTTILGLSAYAFPPTPGSALAWFPVAWTGLAFILHLSIVGWLAIEFYQFPVWAYLRVRRRQLLGR